MKRLLNSGSWYLAGKAANEWLAFGIAVTCLLALVCFGWQAYQGMEALLN